MEDREEFMRNYEKEGARPEQYLPEKEPRLNVEAELAGLVVYGVTIAAWLAVVGFGVAALL